MKAADRSLTVTELNEYVRRSLAMDPLLQGMRLKGEISGFKRHTSGHWYFSLKDEQARINCVMFRQHNMSVRLAPRDGMQVVLLGSVGLFSRDGAYQFYAEGMREDGLGDLFLRFEQLKARLQQEGLFDAARKRPLPLLPKRVGIVTSRTGAVIRDICTVAWRRHPGMELVLFPAAVQGEGAAAQIARGIEVLGRTPGISVIIVGRGGGSMEDLWAFNEEAVARAIAVCPVPVISAVGHETDFTIADFAADMRAPTPSAAAELAMPVRDDLQAGILQMEARLLGGAESLLMEKKQKLMQAQGRLQSLHPSARVLSALHAADMLKERLQNALGAGLALRDGRLQAARARLHALGPMQVLGRGYALAMKAGVPVKGAGEVFPGDRLTVVMADGWVTADAVKVEEGNPFE